MSKEEFIKYIIDNGYTYNETPKQIDVNKIVDDLENQDESITLDKENKEVMLWTTKNGSGKGHILNKFELDVLEWLKGWLDE